MKRRLSDEDRADYRELFLMTWIIQIITLVITLLTLILK